MRYLCFLLVILLFSCNSNIEDEEKTVLARVYTEYLYLEDIADMLPANVSDRDSINILHNLVNRWMQEQVILQKANQNLTEKELDFDRQLDEYRNSLIIYTYEANVVRQYLDTVVSDEEIESYYVSHQQNFELKDIIARVKYVKLHQDSLELNSFRQLIRRENPEDLEELEDLCSKYASNYWFEDSWVYFSELAKRVPIQTEDPESFLRYRKNVEIEDDPFIHLLHISDYQLIGAIAPIEMEWDNIIKIIINNRKLDLKNKMREDLLQAAFEFNEIEVYQ